MNGKNKTLLIIAIIFMAFNLRSPITGVGSLISIIKTQLNLSASSSGIITTIPLIAFAVVSPFVSKLSQEYGSGHLMFYALIFLAAGIMIRSFAGTAGLFIGTAIIGIGIAVGNVMIPSIIKSEFPLKIGMITGIFTTSMSIFAGISSGISVPLSEDVGLGWKNALAIWLVLVIVTMLIWLFQWNLQLKGKNQLTNDSLKKNVYKSSIAWYVALYMGIQSFLYYCFVAWLPTILQAKGINVETGGYYASAYQIIAIPASFVVPLLAVRRKNQKLVTGIISCIYAVSIFMFLIANSTMIIVASVLLCGLCSGGCISLAMSFIGLRSSGAGEAAKLSGMAQSLGYTLAAIGPFILGSIFDLFHSWNIPLMGLIIMAICLLIVGNKAGEDVTI
ncbi:putative transporter YycB [Clostridium ragsdalei P11]|uniref:Putative transporter YycB n=1 Tax=Clostridium ragsdalei P11 TaxID=1353534 RepID=A0A1A6AV19_9CLOT|nr:MFS transporter [Clostridium ragsdalei]OBR93897.1 putative transporter YycB [Clostridium ragsdalei P11]